MDADQFVQAAYDGDLPAVARYVKDGGQTNHSTAKGWTALTRPCNPLYRLIAPATLKELPVSSSIPEPT